MQAGKYTMRPYTNTQKPPIKLVGLMLASANDPVIPNSSSTFSGERSHRDSIHVQATNIGTNTTTLWKQTTLR